MAIDRINFQNICENDLLNLLDARVPEGLTIDYKRDPWGNSDAEKKEALKDISSFANSSGGHLIIGVEESNGIPISLTGLPDVQTDALIGRLESLLRDGVEPRIVGVRIRSVSLRDGGTAVVVRIPKSWNPPHRVSTAKTNRFYVRHSNGAHEASVEELRVMFTVAADAQNRINKFRIDRIDKIAKGEGSVPLPGNGLLIVHLIPLAAFGRQVHIDLEKAFEIQDSFLPVGGAAGEGRVNLDGFINVRTGESTYGYTQVFRNGIVESTKANILASVSGVTVLNATKAARDIGEFVSRCLTGMQALDVPTPVVIMVSYKDVHKSKLRLTDHAYGKTYDLPRRDPLLLPEVIVDDYGPFEAYTALRPVFDALWNSVGQVKCLLYDSNGNWLNTIAHG